MNSILCLSIRLLDSLPEFHGQSGDGEPEWPPSPLRVFQALVAAAGRWREERFKTSSLFALEWLERQLPPQIVSPSIRTGVAIRIAVPNNDMDSVANAWAKGLEPRKQSSELKTLKPVRPTRPVVSDDEPAKIYYLWSLSDPDFENHKQTLFALVRSVTHLGWGIDMVATNASVLSGVDADDLPGERWHPVDPLNAIGLRVPAKGTLDALIDKHDAFLSRLGLEEYSSVPPLTAYRIVGYRRTTDSPHLPTAAFSLRKIDASGFRSFNSAIWGVKVAGMVRHAAKLTSKAQGWPDEKVARFVLGHGEPMGQSPAPVLGPRLAFIPLPTIAPRGRRGLVVESVRRVLITVLNGEGTDEIRDLERLLPGVDMISEQENKPIARLARLLPPDDVLGRYCGGPSATWATVTPRHPSGLRRPSETKEEVTPSGQQRGGEAGRRGHQVGPRQAR